MTATSQSIVSLVLLLFLQVNSQQQSQQATTTTTTQAPATTTTPHPNVQPVQVLFNMFALPVQSAVHGVFEVGKVVADTVQKSFNKMFDSWTFPNFTPPPPPYSDYIVQYLLNQQMNPTAYMQTQTTTRPTTPRQSQG